MNVQQSNAMSSEGRDVAREPRRNAAADSPLVALVIALVSAALFFVSYLDARERAPDIDIAPVTAVPAETARPTDYFPDGYVNRATEPERQYETF